MNRAECQLQWMQITLTKLENNHYGKTNFFPAPLRDISQFKTIEMPCVKSVWFFIKVKRIDAVCWLVLGDERIDVLFVQPLLTLEQPKFVF